MNIEKNYDLENFEKYDNFYTILQKNVPLYERIQDNENTKPKFIIHGEKIKFYPIYGHFYNNENFFIYKKVYRKNILNRYRDVSHYKVSVNELAHPKHSNFFRFETIEELYLTIDELQNNVIKNIS